MLPVIIAFIIMKLASHKFPQLARTTKSIDTLYIELPTTYDTVDVSRIGKDFKRIVFDKFSQPNYHASSGISLDVKRSSSFAIANENITAKIIKKTMVVSSLSDSLQGEKNNFLKRHDFFVVRKNADSCFFYSSKCEYLGLAE